MQEVDDVASIGDPADSDQFDRFGQQPPQLPYLTQRHGLECGSAEPGQLDIDDRTVRLGQSEGVGKGVDRADEARPGWLAGQRPDKACEFGQAGRIRERRNLDAEGRWSVRARTRAGDGFECLADLNADGPGLAVVKAGDAFLRATVPHVRAGQVEFDDIGAGQCHIMCRAGVFRRAESRDADDEWLAGFVRQRDHFWQVLAVVFKPRVRQTERIEREEIAGVVDVTAVAGAGLLGDGADDDRRHGGSGQRVDVVEALAGTRGVHERMFKLDAAEAGHDDSLPFLTRACSAALRRVRCATGIRRRVRVYFAGERR